MHGSNEPEADPEVWGRFPKSETRKVERAEKQDLVASMHEVFSNAATVIVVHYDGLSVAEITALRAQMREVGASLKVTKNRLTRLALKGTEYEGIADLFTGPTAIGFALNKPGSRLSDPKSASAMSSRTATSSGSPSRDEKVTRQYSGRCRITHHSSGSEI